MHTTFLAMFGPPRLVSNVLSHSSNKNVGGESGHPRRSATVHPHIETTLGMGPCLVEMGTCTISKEINTIVILVFTRLAACFPIKFDQHQEMGSWFAS
jgi:hypothetical protein